VCFALHSFIHLAYIEAVDGENEDKNDTEDKNEGEAEQEEDIDQPVFSLVTGKYRQAKRYGATSNSNGAEGDSTSLVVRNQEDALALALPGSAAGESQFSLPILLSFLVLRFRFFPSLIS
jgi:hypothetical protein